MTAERSRRICADCRNFLEQNWSQYCRLFEYTELIKGTTQYRHCQTVRDGVECGPEGKLWEAKS